MPSEKQLSVPERLDRLEQAMLVVLTALHPMARADPPITAEVVVGLTTWVHDLLHGELERFGGRLEPEEPTP